MFGLFSKKKPAGPTPEVLVVARLNMKLQPMTRGELFEDTLQPILEQTGLGEVAGGGTQLREDGEIEFCDLEIRVHTADETTVDTLVEALNAIGAAKGSKLLVGDDGAEVPFGLNEGLAVYLNGTDLPDEVYTECDCNVVYDEFEKALGEDGFILNTWQGPTESALYCYGKSFDLMQSKIAPFMAEYPLCEKARVVQMA
jgi:hypothetical protein